MLNALVQKNKPLMQSRIDPVLEDRVLGAYVGLAVGDALGATVEFMTPAEIKEQYGIHKEIIGGGWLKLKKGKVTDDTTMSLAMGQAILDTGTIEAVSIAESFSKWMSNRPVDIGHTVRRGIIHYRQKGATQVQKNEYDAGNGACMRTLPIALATLGATPEQIQQASRTQAHITHNNPLSDAGTECVIHMIHCALQDCPKTKLKEFAYKLGDDHKQFIFTHRRRENPSGFIVETLQAVFQALSETTNFESAMVEVINRGGDADTTGAILGMIAGAYYGLDAIPATWRNKVDKQTLDECTSQAIELIQLSPGSLDS